MLIVMPILVKRMVPDHHSHVVGTYLDAVRIAFYAEIVESADAYLLAGPILMTMILFLSRKKMRLLHGRIKL